jgi:acyl carrier protein
MSLPTTQQLSTLTSLIREVKPGLGDLAIEGQHSLVEHLGLDSLDILQLARKVNRQIGAFDLDSWNAGQRTVQSILDQVNGAAAASPA